MSLAIAEPPTQEELRALMPPLGFGDPNADFWAEAKPRHLANDACKDCHAPILDLHSHGEHRTLACEDCHHVHDPMKWVHEAREMVGLPEMMASIPLLEEKLAKEKQAPYSTMSEIFLVFPLAPGVLGMVVSEGEGQFPAEVMIVTGLVLSIGSYLLGQYVLSRELENIRALNDERRAANMRVKDHNILIKKAMADHERAVKTWLEESEGRGRVIVTGVE